MPIRMTHDRWMDKFSEHRAAVLVNLQTTARAAHPTTEQVYQIFIKAAPTAIWDDITKPDLRDGYFYGSRVETPGQASTPFRYHSPDSTRLWDDEPALEADTPRRFVVTRRSLYNPELTAEPRSRAT